LGISLSLTLWKRAAVKRLPAPPVPTNALNGLTLDLPLFVSYAFFIRSMEDKQAC